MTDQQLREFLKLLEQVTALSERVGILWSQLISATTGCSVTTYDPATALHVDICRNIIRAATAVIEEANSTRMRDWNVRRVNELGNALEGPFSRKFNELGSSLRCLGFAQTAGYPDRRIQRNHEVVAYIDLKTYEENSAASTFRSFYYQPREARSKIQTSALHLLLAFPHGPLETVAGRNYWRLAGAHLLDLSELRVKLKGEFQASNRDLYTTLSRIELASVGEKNVSE
jgi:hypothetical protein